MSAKSTQQLQLGTSTKTGREGFEEIVTSHRGKLLAHCYRFTGSLHDAEDLVQETMLRAWRAIDRFESRSSLQSWLYRIATNVCLTAVRRKASARRVLPDNVGGPTSRMPIGGPSTTDIPWIEPLPDSMLENLTDASPGPAARYELRETIRLAFIAATQQLPARQRAVLLLCDVLGWSASETAETLSMSVASVNSALQRARGTMGKGLSAEDVRDSAGAEGRHRSIAHKYADAWESTDLKGLVSLLAKDASLVMPPFSEWYLGRAAIRTFIGWFYDWSWNEGIRGAFRMVPTQANGQFALGSYARLRPATKFQARALHVLSFRKGKIHRITIFVGAKFFSKFGLAPELGAG
ncbi:MAG TPA: sigma-70 family RNA polymerase sigma factor [Chthoniobacterales bacterium]